MDLARRHRATYTRYADDLTFSFSVRAASRLPENICAFESGGLTLGHELLSIIERNNFQVNPAKSRMSTRETGT
jgi:RNA-directed DNA polymerase